MNILVIGAGSIGWRHIRNLLKLGHKNVSIVETDKNQRFLVEKEFKLPVYRSSSQAFSKNRFKVVFICTPADSHISLASKAVQAGAHIFIEKPLAIKERGINDLIRLVREKGVIAMVACNFRFHPGYKMLEGLVKKRKFGRSFSARIIMGHDLLKSRPNENYRKVYDADGKKGGGVIFDSGAHVLDYLAQLFGWPEKLTASYGNLSGLKIKAEDFVSFILEYPSGIRVTVELDYFSRPKRHNLEVQFEKGWVKWDFAGNSFESYSQQTKKLEKFKVYKNSSLDFMRNDMYLKEIKHFFKIIRKGGTPTQTIKDARNVISVLDLIKQSGIAGRSFKLKRLK